MSSLLRFDRKWIGDATFLAGVDEAGRGALAGPVVAGAVFLDPAQLRSSWSRKTMAEVNDSKQLSPARRERLYEALQEGLATGKIAGAACGEGSVEEIAEWNILGANREAMRRALVAACPPEGRLPEMAAEGLFASGEPSNVRIIVDGKPLRPFPFDHVGIVKGDAQSFVIALASILAKVTRDRAMERWHETYPDYGFSVHKGYGTPEHRDALGRVGACPLHRALFLRKILGAPGEAPVSSAEPELRWG